MKAIEIQDPEDAPFVPPTRVCRCRVPHLRSGHDYFTGWGVTFCQRCDRFYCYGVSGARKYAYIPRLGGKK